MMQIIYTDTFLSHDTGSFHPECSARLTAIVEALKAAQWNQQLQWRSPTSVEQRDPLPYIQKCHHQTYINLVRQMASSGGGRLDADTPVSPKSYNVALLAVNAWLDGVDAALSQNKPVFVLCRPPGHHATYTHGMGFCLFSNAAIAANYALEQSKVERIAILDWDVHHGNGTEDIVQNNPDILYCSLHQFPCYPGTGQSSDRGKYNNVMNFPLPPESNIKTYQPLFETEIMPRFREFKPDMILVSAGYDANKADQLASMALKPEDYGLFTDYLLEITPNIVFGLEGGYDLEALSQSVVITVERCLRK
jgi:acetoin utilization deacetylase AcuC-like enzyme